jgi:hypothetical protein
MKEGKKLLKATLDRPGVYVLYRGDEPYYIGKSSRPLIKRLGVHALKPNGRRYNFWDYFSAFTIDDGTHRDEVEAILISAMPSAANSSKPKIPRMPLDRTGAKLLNEIQALMLTGRGDTSGESEPEEAEEAEKQWRTTFRGALAFAEGLRTMRTPCCQPERSGRDGRAIER